MKEDTMYNFCFKLMSKLLNICDKKLENTAPLYIPEKKPRKNSKKKTAK